MSGKSKVIMLLCITGILVALLMYGVQQRKSVQIERVRSEEMVMPQTVELNIKGMACSNCVRNVKRALGEVPAVKEVEVDLKSGKAVVQVKEGKVTAKQLLDAVEQAGFEAEINH